MLLAEDELKTPANLRDPGKWSAAATTDQATPRSRINAPDDTRKKMSDS